VVIEGTYLVPADSPLRTIQDVDRDGVARPLLLPAFSSHREVSSKLERMVHELRISALLSGSKDLEDLKQAPKVISGELLNWATQRRLAVGKNA
jgi:hypothetical protein